MKHLKTSEAIGEKGFWAHLKHQRSSYISILMPYILNRCLHREESTSGREIAGSHKISPWKVHERLEDGKLDEQVSLSYYHKCSQTCVLPL